MSDRLRARYSEVSAQDEAAPRRGTPGARSRVDRAYPSHGSPVQRLASPTSGSPRAPGPGAGRRIAPPTPVQLLSEKGGARPGLASGEGGGEAASGVRPADPAADSADRKVARLYLLIDVEVKHLGLKDLMNGDVGHTWISIEYLDPHAVPASVPGNHRTLLQKAGRYADPMGFWPDIQNNVYYSANPFKSWVKGWMRHPDRAHQGAEKAVQVWEITQAEVDAVIRYAESKRGANYSVYFFNCTTFGKEAVQAAGKSAPSMSTAGICFPNAAYEGVKARQQKGQGHTMVTDLDSDQTTEVEGAESKKSK